MAGIPQNTTKHGFFANPGAISGKRRHIFSQNYAKRTQFAKSQNALKCFIKNRLWQNPPIWPPKKRTQTNPIYENPTCHLDWPALSAVEGSEAKWRDLFLSSFLMQNLQNEPNFQNDKMNTTYCSTKDYEKNPHFSHPKNEPNSNPTCPEHPVVSKPVLSIL